MSSYPKLKLVQHIPANLASVLNMEEGEETPMFQFPFTLRVTGRDEAFILLVCDRDDEGFYGFTMLYYEKKADGWYRWLLESPELPREKRWRKAVEPFSGLDSAIGYERRTEGILPYINGEDLQAVVSASLFNGTYTFTGGKYSGRTLREVLNERDFAYVQWLWENRPELRECFFIQTITKKDKDAEDKAGTAGAGDQDGAQ